MSAPPENPVLHAAAYIFLRIVVVIQLVSAVVLWRQHEPICAAACLATALLWGFGVVAKIFDRPPTPAG